MTIPFPGSAGAPAPRVLVFSDADAASRYTGQRVERTLGAATESSPAVIALPTGNTPSRLYRRLVKRRVEGAIDFEHAWILDLDEYWPIEAENPWSFQGDLTRRLLDPIGIEPSRRLLLRGNVPENELESYCRAHENRIVELGGLDLGVLGLGVNGHVAYNEPGSSADSRTRRVDLTPETRASLARANPGLGPPPKHAVTLGIGTLREACSLVLVALGASKAEIVARALLEPPDPAVPASLLRGHPDLTFVLDRDAAANLPAEMATLEAAQSE